MATARWFEQTLRSFVSLVADPIVRGMILSSSRNEDYLDAQCKSPLLIFSSF